MDMTGRTMKTILLAGFIGIWATNAIAHSPLESTTPANEAIIAEVPTEVLFDFKRRHSSDTCDADPRRWRQQQLRFEQP